MTMRITRCTAHTPTATAAGSCSETLALLCCCAFEALPLRCKLVETEAARVSGLL